MFKLVVSFCKFYILNDPLCIKSVCKLHLAKNKCILIILELKFISKQIKCILVFSSVIKVIFINLLNIKLKQTQIYRLVALVHHMHTLQSFRENSSLKQA